MILTKLSLLSRKSHSMDLPISEKEFLLGIEEMERGAMIQDAFPQLSSEHREFILTGITPDEWYEAFKDGNVH